MRTGRFLAVLFLTQLALASPTAAADPPAEQPEPAATPVEVQEAAAEPTVKSATPVDAMTVLDDSGSMKKNDPKFLMREVVLTFSTSLAPNSRLGIILFDENVEVALGLTDVGAADFKEQVAKSLKRLDYRGQLTDIPAGVERAIYEFRAHGRPEAQRVIIFLTDGIVDVGNPTKDLERARWLREELAQEAKRLGIRIFGIALTEAADFQLIQSVAQTTGGDYFRVLAASDIPGTFEQISARIEEMTRVVEQTTKRGLSVTAVLSGPTPTSRLSPTVVKVLVPFSDRWLWLLGAIGFVVVVGIVVVALRGSRMPAVTLYDRGGHSGKEKYSITKSVTRIGRAETNDIVIPYDTVSGEHAEVVFRSSDFYLRDLKSLNGTFVNGKKFSDRETIHEVPLKNRDRIRFDAYEFEFVINALEDVQQTVDAGAAPAGGTRLRAEPPAPQIREPETPSPQPTIPKPIEAGGGAAGGPAPAEVTPAAGNGEAKTRLKTDECPIHKSLKATELCPVCGTAYCKVYCMKEKEGQVFCPKGHLQQ